MCELAGLVVDGRCMGRSGGWRSRRNSMMNMMMINRRKVPGWRKEHNAGGGSEHQEGQQQPYQPDDEHSQTPDRFEEEFSAAPVQENAPAKSYQSRNDATEGKSLTLPSSLRVCRGM